ncbi:MAG: hypothetical protein M1833_005355 [Piccolia ochrophora]|nr:MAG: hypothetical protein M1833_005355 [Piccolia ochrophora]
MADPSGSTLTSRSTPADPAPDHILFLRSLLNRTLHVTTTDDRLFVGQLKCTDRDRNVILALTHEYRQPSATAIREAAALAAARGEPAQGNVKVDMTKRFLGLVVVPGEHITKVEVEERVGVEEGTGS